MLAKLIYREMRDLGQDCCYKSVAITQTIVKIPPDIMSEYRLNTLLEIICF